MSRLSGDNIFWAGGVGLTIAAYAFLLEGAPTFSVILLMIAWGLIAVAIYRHNFFEGKSRRLQITGNIVIPGLVAVIFAVTWLALRPESQAESTAGSPSIWSSLTEWLVICVTYVGGLPWRWIVPSFGIGALAVGIYAFLRERRRQHLLCPDKRLHRFAVGDKKEIKNLVKVCGVQCRKMAEGREPVHLDFTFAILNMSLFKISVDSIDGHIIYHESGNAYIPKLAPRLETNEARDLTFRQTGHFVVQQNFLTEAEADYILKGPIDTIFSLKTLKITVTGEGLESNLLNTDFTVKKDDKWLDYNESYFFSSGIAARNSNVEITSGKAVLTERNENTIIPEIKEAHLIPSDLGADCFARLEVRSSKSDPIRVMDYQMKLITKTGEYVGRWADATGYCLIDRSGGERGEDGQPEWIDISKEALTNLPRRAPISRGNPLTGWLRFRFEGLPKWAISSGELIDVVIETDEYEDEYHREIYDTYFSETTATGLVIVLTDSDGKQTECHSENVSCDQSRTVKKEK